MSRPIVSIVDYGLGNLFSVKQAFQKCGAEVEFVRSPLEVINARLLVLPGVGAFADGMAELRYRRLDMAIKSYASSGAPLLGICLGMQMLGTISYEFGCHEGLNLIPGSVRSIQSMCIDGSYLKSPHIGWAKIHEPTFKSWDKSILSDTAIGSAVYLVHSYTFHVEYESDLLAVCDYGGHKMAAAIRRNNVTGCQFHPEKSGSIGLGILANFASQLKMQS